MRGGHRMARHRRMERSLQLRGRHGLRFLVSLFVYSRAQNMALLVLDRYLAVGIANLGQEPHLLVR